MAFQVHGLRGKKYPPQKARKKGGMVVHRTWRQQGNSQNWGHGMEKTHKRYCRCSSGGALLMLHFPQQLPHYLNRWMLEKMAHVVIEV